MKIAIMQPYLFPYLGYFQLLSAIDTFVIYDDVNYINKGYINRNSIVVNGQVLKFTLELIGASQNKLINDIQVGNNVAKILKTIGLAYKKAPCFAQAFPMITEILLNTEKNLARFIGASLQVLANYLGISTHFLYSSEIDKNPNLRGQDKIIAICETLQADTYLNPIGGVELYDKTLFAQHQIQLFFLKGQLPSYRQFTTDFIPALSIIDVLMFNDPEQVVQMLAQYQLI